MKPKTIFAAIASLFSITIPVSEICAQVVTESIVCTTVAHTHETCIAIDPINPDTLIVVWNDFDDPVQPGYSFSTNGGNSWSAPTVVPNVSDTVTGGFDPSAVFDRNHRCFYCYCGAQQDPFTRGPVYSSSSTNLGSNWNHQKVTKKCLGILSHLWTSLTLLSITRVEATMGIYMLFFIIPGKIGS